MPKANPDHQDEALAIGSKIALPYTIIRIEGSDAEKFLQGQLSCDVVNLAPGEVRFGTANTPKGRMIALFKICRQEQDFLIRVHREIATPFVQHLAKYKVFFKCEITIPEGYQVVGMLGGESGSQVTGSDCDLSNNDGSTSHILIEDSLNSDLGLYEHWSAQPDPLAAEDADQAEYWHCMETLQGLPELYPETVEKFILQHLNLHLLHAVSFKKGCYTGQEIIARMKYLGKQKKEMALLTSDQKPIAKPGDAIHSSTGDKLGELVRMHYHSSLGCVALAVFPSDMAPSQMNVNIGQSTDIPFEMKKLAYS